MAQKRWTQRSREARSAPDCPTTFNLGTMTGLSNPARDHEQSCGRDNVELVTRRAVRQILSASMLLGATVAAPRARADDPPPNGIGIVGASLLGGELVLLGETFAGVQSPWWYVVGGATGAGLGGWAGWRIEQDVDRDASFVLLTAGVALVIPTVVWMARHHSRKAPSEPLPLVEPQAQLQPSAPLAPPALVAMSERRVHLGTPTLELHPVHTGLGRELNIEQVYELRVPLVAGRF